MCVGLRDDSRIKMRQAGLEMKPVEYLLAAICDRLSILTWQNSKNGTKGKNFPKLLLSAKEEKKEIVAFDSPEAFEEARRKILEGL